MPAQSPKPPNSPKQKHHSPKPKKEVGQAMDISQEIVQTINNLDGGKLHAYPIRKLVQQAEKFGPYLKQQRLETNQIRKFLDAVNRLKVKRAQYEENRDRSENEQQIFAAIEPEIVLLKPKLAYAAARQKAAKPLSQVMSAAIDRVESLDDFSRLVQLIEAIIAYHKAEGGK